MKNLTNPIITLPYESVVGYYFKITTMAWVSEKERKPEHNKFVKTKLEPVSDKFSEVVLIYNEVIEKWMKPGTYDEVLYPPSHWWDDTITENDGKD